MEEGRLQRRDPSIWHMGTDRERYEWRKLDLGAENRANTILSRLGKIFDPYCRKWLWLMALHSWVIGLQEPQRGHFRILKNQIGSRR